MSLWKSERMLAFPLHLKNLSNQISARSVEKLTIFTVVSGINQSDSLQGYLPNMTMTRTKICMKISNGIVPFLL